MCEITRLKWELGEECAKLVNHALLVQHLAAGLEPPGDSCNFKEQQRGVAPVMVDLPGDNYRHMIQRRLAPGCTCLPPSGLEMYFASRLKTSARRYCRGRIYVLPTLDMCGLQGFGDISKVNLLVFLELLLETCPTIVARDRGLACGIPRVMTQNDIS